MPSLLFFRALPQSFQLKSSVVMKQKRITPLSLFGFAMLSLLFFNSIASADSEYFSPPRNTPKAVAHASESQACVEPIETMRRQHMEFIKHQRDETMHKGIRTTKYSLLECINCHVTYDENQQAVSYKDEQHFCSGCHQYAAVNIDCFQCHNSKPTPSVVKPMPGHPEFISPITIDMAKQAQQTTGGASE